MRHQIKDRDGIWHCGKLKESSGLYPTALSLLFHLHSSQATDVNMSGAISLAKFIVIGVVQLAVDSRWGPGFRIA